MLINIRSKTIADYLIIYRTCWVSIKSGPPGACNKISSAGAGATYVVIACRKPNINSRAIRLSDI